MTSSLDLPLGDLISQNRSGGRRQGGRGGRRDGGARRDGAASSSGGAEGESSAAGGHPLDRSGNEHSSSGPIRHERRRAGPRGAPRSEGNPFSRNFGNSDSLLPSAPLAATKLIGDTVRLSNLSPDITEDDLRYIFDKIGQINRITIHFNSQGKSVGTAEVQFGSNAAAALAVENLDSAEVDGRIMYVNIIASQIMQASYPQIRRDDRRGDDRRDGRRGGGDDRRGDSRRDGDRQRRDGGARQGGADSRKEGGAGGRRGGAGKGEKGGNKEGGAGRGAGREARPAPVGADLDAEMDSWMASARANSAAAAATTTTTAPATEASAPMATAAPAAQ